MPSASTTRPLAGSAATESSLCERTIPGSVALAISMTSVRFKERASQLDIARACGGCRLRRGATERGAQCPGELFARLEALVRVLGHRAVEEGDQPRRHVGL